MKAANSSGAANLRERPLATDNAVGGSRKGTSTRTHPAAAGQSSPAVDAVDAIMDRIDVQLTNFDKRKVRRFYINKSLHSRRYEAK